MAYRVPELQVWFALAGGYEVVEDEGEFLVPEGHETVVEVELKEAVNFSSELLPVFYGSF